MATSSDEKEADVWELRCRFKRGRFFERWSAGEFYTIPGEPGTPSRLSRQPATTVSRTVYYIDPATDEEVAQVHFFLHEDGQIGGGGQHDPKGVLVDGVRYKRRSGKGVAGEIGRDPSLGLPPGTVRECYKCFRRLCCDALGSAADRAIASITTKFIVRAKLSRRPT
jgi:hypothetical protein